MIVAVVGPSGAGKDTLIAGAVARCPGLTLVRRVITRPTGAGGEDFEGVSQPEFAARKARGEFAVCWQAHGLSYGIPRAQLAGDGPYIFNGSRAALPAAKAAFPDLRVVLVTAPDAVLAERLAARGRETEADIRARLERAAFEVPAEFGAVVVVNDGTPASGVDRLLAAIQPQRA